MQISIGNIIKGDIGAPVPKNTPILPGLIVYYNVDDVSSYDFSTTKTQLNNLAASGGYTGTIIRDSAGLYPEDVTASPSTICGYGRDSNGKFLYFTRSSSRPMINVPNSLSLTDWTVQFKVKNRGLSSSNSYYRFFGVVNYDMELVHNSGNIWFYNPSSGGWNNTGVSYPNDGKYHTFTFTYTNSPRQLNLYLDATLVYSSGSSGSSLSTSQFWVQGSQDSRQEPSYWNKFLIYDRALNQTEINNNDNI